MWIWWGVGPPLARPSDSALKAARVQGLTKTSFWHQPWVLAPCFAALTLFWSLVALFCLPFSRGRGVGWIGRRWGKGVLQICGVSVQVDGALQGSGPRLVMANHASHFDVPVLYGCLPVDMKAVAKRELGFIPLFGWVLALGAAVMIDRKDREKAVAALARAQKNAESGVSLLLFPEGTRSKTGTLGPFKKGPFHLAAHAGTPIVPVGLSGTQRILKPGDWRIRPGGVRLCVGAPIDPAAFSHDDAGRAQLSEAVHQAIEALSTRPGA